jgi:ABC-type multidrug transport system ATPase subunit
MSIVKMEHLSKALVDFNALDDVGFNFEHGILGILGPSGCDMTIHE